MSDALLIYGARGYTGRLIVGEARARGLYPILGGRSRERLERLALQQALEWRVAALEQPDAVAAMLSGVRVVLNAAGPYRATARPLAEACVARGIHYLDISGEVPAIEDLCRLNAPARACGSMVLAGVGFDVVPTDCLAALLARRLPGARSLAIGLSGLRQISKGSLATAFDQYRQLVLVRRQGRVIRVPPGQLVAEFDFGAGPRAAAAVSWGDVASAYYTTGIENITVYFEQNASLALSLGLGQLAAPLWDAPLARYWRELTLALVPDGPSPEYRARARAVAVARVTDERGRSLEARLETPEVYTFTATTSVAIAERVLAGDLTPGYQTPARAYGAGYVLSLPGVVLSMEPRPS